MPNNFVLPLFRIWYNQKCDSLFINKEEERLSASKSLWARGQKKKKAACIRRGLEAIGEA